MLITKAVLEAAGVGVGSGRAVRWEGGVWDGAAWVQGLWGWVLPGVCAGGHLAHPPVGIGRELRELVRASGHRGIVALMLDEESRPLEAVSELPAGGTRALEQGIVGGVSAWRAAPVPLLESWVVSVEAAGAAERCPLPRRLERRWVWSPQSPPLGWAVAWSNRLPDAVRRAEWAVAGVARELGVELTRAVGTLAALRHLDAPLAER